CSRCGRRGCRRLVRERARGFWHTPRDARQRASGNVDRVLAQNRRCGVEEEVNRPATTHDHKGVGGNSVHCEIACLDICRTWRTQVDSEISRWTEDSGTTVWTSHRTTRCRCYAGSCRRCSYGC